MNRRSWLGALAGGTAGLLAWLISLPFLPVKTVSSGTTFEQAARDAAASFTVGAFYGVLGSLLLGALAGLLISLVYQRPRSVADRVRTGIIATALGAILVCAADACSEAIGLGLTPKSGGGAVVGVLATCALWALLTSAGLCAALIFSFGIRPRMFVRLFVAIGVGAVVALLLRGVADVATAFIVAPMLMHKGAVNSWSIAAPGFLASNVALGAAVGACIGVSENLTSGAWVHLALTYGEGTTWSMDWPIARIGHDEGVEIRLEEMQGLAPLHAQIQRHGTDYAIQDLGGGTRLNGNQVPSAWLADNDVLTLGPYELVFHLRRPVPRRAYDLPPGAIVVTPENTPAGAAVKLPRRFEDDFGNVYPLAEDMSIVGRDASCQVRVTFDATISRRHAEILIGKNGAMIRDLGSSNGTRLNGTVIQSVKVPLKEGDLVEFGTARLTYHE